ncbi:MAG: GNAT family N-acetyltransferase, partial [Gaiellaceae bacterium]
MPILLDQAAVRDVILRDGRTLRLRAPRAEDRIALLAFFEAMSPRSRYLRFHGYPSLDDRLVERFTDVDWNETGCVVGDLDGSIVACASWARLREPRTAEVAFAVADELQGLGVG